MKLKTLLIVLFLSLFFVGTQSSTFEAEDLFVSTYDISAEVSDQVEESEDNRSFLQHFLSFSYFSIETCAIFYNHSFFLQDYFIDIEKPPIIS